MLRSLYPKTVLRLALALVVWLPAWIQAQPVPRSACFALDRLPAEQRAESNELLLRVLDSEALYTIIGGLKPMSGGVPSLNVRVNQGDLSRVAEIRDLMEAWSCGDDVQFAFHHYARAYSGKDDGSDPSRSLAGVVFNRPAMAKLIARHPALFAPLGITPNAHPMEVLMAIEYNETANRYRGYGFLFGYPDEAVEFFAANTFIPQDRNPDPNEAVSPVDVKPSPRKFINIPTFGREEGSFVYAVPPDHEEDEVDCRLRERAESILNSYRRRRAIYIGEGKPGAAALLRDWFCIGNDNCSPANATLDPVCPEQRVVVEAK